MPSVTLSVREQVVPHLCRGFEASGSPEVRASSHSWPSRASRGQEEVTLLVSHLPAPQSDPAEAR